MLELQEACASLPLGSRSVWSPSHSKQENWRSPITARMQISQSDMMLLEHFEQRTTAQEKASAARSDLVRIEKLMIDQNAPSTQPEPRVPLRAELNPTRLPQNVRTHFVTSALIIELLDSW